MKGMLQLERVEAPSLVGNPLGDPSTRTVPVYLPPAYASSAARYPVVYFLHAFTGSGSKWLNVTPFSPSVPERLDALIAGGELPALIAVFSDAWTAFGGSQYLNSPAMGRYEDSVADDLVAHVDGAFRTLARPEGRALLGHSSGGYGALSLARRRPGIFRHLGVHAADSYFEYCYLPDFPKVAGLLEAAGGLMAWWTGFQHRARHTRLRGEDHTVLNLVAMAAAYSPDPAQPLGLALPFCPRTARIQPEIWERWLARDPVRFLVGAQEALGQLGGAFVDCGTRDEVNLRWGMRMVAEELASQGVEVVHEEFDGGHGGNSYRYDRSLRFLGERLARE